MNHVCVIPIRVFKSLNYSDFLKIQGVGFKSADFLTNLNKRIINSEQKLKITIQQYNQKTNNKIRYNFINNNLIILDNKLIYTQF